MQELRRAEMILIELKTPEMSVNEPKFAQKSLHKPT